MLDDLSQTGLLDELKLEALQDYDKDLKVYLSIKNRIHRDVYLKEIVEKYRPILGLTQSEVVGHAAIVSLPEEDVNHERKVYSLAELLTIQNQASAWLVPNLISMGGGLFMCAGSPKAGKSLVFAYQLAYSIAVSGEFLGFPVTKGKVLIFQCEESIGKVARTFRSKGLNDFVTSVETMVAEAVSSDLIQIETEFAIDADLDYLKKRVREYQPSLVIYDSLRAITKHLPVSENSVDISKYVYTLQKIHNYLQVPGLIIHHASKNAKDRGVEGMAGSLSLAGATDGVILLYKDKDKKNKGEHEIELITEPREGLPIHWLISRNKPLNGYWTYKLEEDLAVDPEQVRLERRILQFLCSQSEAAVKPKPTLFSAFVIAESLNLDPSNTVFQGALNRLVDSLQIGEEIQNDNGLPVSYYWIAPLSPWYSLVKVSFNDEIDDANLLAQCKSKEEIDALSIKWLQSGKPDTYKRKIWGLLSETEKLSVTTILNPPKFEVGSWVRLLADSEKELHQVELFQIKGKEGWFYQLENKETYAESELEIALDYAEASYEDEF
jgi:hypothetical protein